MSYFDDDYNGENLLIEGFVLSLCIGFLGLVTYEIFCYTHNKEWYGYILWGLAGTGLGLASGLIISIFLAIIKINILHFSWKGWTILILFIISTSGYIIYPSDKYLHENKKCDCDNVDDCLSKYKFEEARTFASALPVKRSFWDGDNEILKHDAMLKIIEIETYYWISQNDLVRAENVTSELLTINSETNEMNKKYIELEFLIVKKYCGQNKYDEANSIALKLPEKIISNKKKINIRHLSHLFGQDDIDECESKYNEIKGVLESNQEIEPFKNSSDADYTITTFYNFRSEALKFINEFKKKND